MESSPAGVQSSSSMRRPAAACSLLQVHLLKSGPPHARPMQFKFSNCPSSRFHHIQCLFWQRDMEQLFELQPKWINSASCISRLVTGEKKCTVAMLHGHASVLHPQTCCPSGCQSLTTLLLISLRF